MNNNSQMLKKIFIPVIILLAVAGIYFGFRLGELFSKKEDEIIDNIKKEEKLEIKDKEEQKEEQITDNSKIFEDAKKIIEEELYILQGLNNSKNIPKEIKAKLALNLYCGKKGSFEICKTEGGETIDAKDLEATYNNSSLSNFPFENSSIYCFPYDKEHLNDNHFIWEYNPDTDKYFTNHGGHGGNNIELLYKKLISETNEDGLYTIKYHYVFVSSSDMGESLSYNIFQNYADLLNYNIYKEVSSTRTDYEEYKKSTINEIDNLYNNDVTFKDGLDVYTYTFELINGKLKLKEYSI